MKYLKLFENFSPKLEELNNIITFDKRKEYCKNNFSYIAQGTDRIVFKINEDKVLKLTKNNRGYIQSNNEYNISLSGNKMVTKIYEKTDYYIISEYAPVITKKEINNILGFNFERYSLYLTKIYLKNDLAAFEHRLKWVYNNIDLTKDEIIFFENNEFTKNIINIADKYDLYRDDLIRINSYGKRLNTNEIILIDYGLKNH